jgi:hypothetical protein
MAHKECSGVGPITDFISNVKSSPAMLDLEQTLRELGSYVKSLIDDKEENIQEILTRKKEICEEIQKIRKTRTIMYRTVHVVWFIVIFTMVLHGLDNSWQFFVVL